MSLRLKIGRIIFLIEIISYCILESMPRENLHIEFFGIGMLIPPMVYYLVAGVFSFLSLKFIANSGNDLLVVDMVQLALIMLACQILGLAIYYIKLPAEIYNYIIMIVLSLQFLRLLWKREGDGVDRNSDIVFFSRSLTMSRNRNLC